MAHVFPLLRNRTQPSQRTEPCIVCGHTRFARISTRDRRRSWLPTVACRCCGLVSHEQIPTDAEVAAYYADQYRQDYHGEVEPAPHRVVRAWKGGEWLAALLEPYLPEDGDVCEIGSGIGCTVKVLENNGYRVVGIEPHRGFVEYSRTKIGAKVEAKNLFEMTGVPTFDFILLVHVIEHFNSPRRALEQIHRLLKPNGQLYVECPNFGGPHAAPGKQFHYAHVYNFTSESLQNLAKVCGFETEANLAGENEGVLRFILRRSSSKVELSPEGGFERLQETLKKHTLLSYYLRPSYLGHRLSRDARFLKDRFRAGTRVQSLFGKSKTKKAA